jgi:hypothetical protein
MMQEQVLGYWVMMATRGGELQRWGHPNTPGFPFVAERDALAYAGGVALASTCDSVYVMTIFRNGSLSMRTICRPARDPSGPVDDAGSARYTGMAGF